MTEKEALKLALEALKYPLNQSHENFNVDMAELLAHRAITAIKEALREHAMYEVQRLGQEIQPEQEPVIGTKTWFEDGKVVTQNLTAKDIYKDLEQPEPEPVAWAQFSETGNLIDLLEEPCGGYVPLYTTPPQRKPLTDEEIDEIYFKSSLEVDNRCEDIYDFARTIEAKLKEKNT